MLTASADSELQFESDARHFLPVWSAFRLTGLLFCCQGNQAEDRRHNDQGRPVPEDVQPLRAEL